MESNRTNPISINIPNYNGPLEILLDLAKSQKVDLAEISITKLADQFLEFIKNNENLNLETASEFLLMATWLAYLKSKLLLPEDEEDDFKALEVAEKLKLQLKKLELIRILSLAMTAHILYSKIDSKNVSTFSQKIINEIIRKKIGFKGILMSDDISMRALKYDLITNAKKSLLAGCNLVLYCAGNIKDNFKLIKSVPYIDQFTIKKTSEIYKIIR